MFVNLYPIEFYEVLSLIRNALKHGLLYNNKMAIIDKALEKFKEIIKYVDTEFSESDTRAKILDPIFKDVLGWDKSDIKREEYVHKGFLDYIFHIKGIPIFVLEAKKIGSSFTIPFSLRNIKYKIRGTITTDKNIKDTINQVARYSQEIGVTYAIISNGKQFLIFESFKRGGKWRDNYCTVFRSFEDIVSNFTFFWNILSKESVLAGSLRIYISEDLVPLRFHRPLDLIHNENAIVGKNILSYYITPLAEAIFSDLTDDAKLDVLEKCYIRQKETSNYNRIFKTNFDRLPHYYEEFKIEQLIESESSAGKFQLSFEKCQSFLKNHKPRGSLMILLGGIGSGKTTFIHHFFKIVLKDREDILWFYINFGESPPEIEEIENYIYTNILQQYREKYSNTFKEIFKNISLDDIKANQKDILSLFALLTYQGKTISLILDNVDQHSYISPLYQEKVFEFAQYLTPELKTITILNLREESYFKATKSGVLDAYFIPKFHISSPNFEDLLRKRLRYAISLLNKSKEEIEKFVNHIIDDTNKNLLNLFFKIILNSVRKTRRQGKQILKYISDISGGDMRQALRLFNQFMISGNTDISEMFLIELGIPEDTPPHHHYQIPLHHIIKSIILGDYLYYGSNRSFIMNVFQVNPKYSNSHFIYLKILSFLYKRISYYVALDKGFVPINDIIYQAELGGLVQKGIEFAMIKLAENKLIEFDNQKIDGFHDAIYCRIAVTGIYYIESLIHSFAYLDLIFGDTLISDNEILKYLRQSFSYDDIKSTYDRIQKRFERVDKYINYLKESEEYEFDINPLYRNSELTEQKFIDNIISMFNNEKREILKRVKRD